MNKTYNKYLSTREVSSLMNVTETTIKRWTDSQKLKCTKTIGGHRKYFLEDIIEFSKANNIPLSGMIESKIKPQDDLEYFLYKKNYDEISKIFFKIILYENVDEIYGFMLHLYRNQISYADIIDKVVVGTFKMIGESWEEQEIEIIDEHRATQAVKMALNRLAMQLKKKPSKETKIICSCIENDYHDLGLLALSIGLEIEGYQVIYLGENTPFKSIKNAVIKYSPDFVCLSAKQVSNDKNFLINKTKDIYRTLKKINSNLILGGEGYSNYADEIKSYDLIAYSIKDVIEFINKQIKQNKIKE